MGFSPRRCEVSKDLEDGLLKGLLLGFRQEAKTPSIPRNHGPGGRRSPSPLGIEAFRGTQLLFVASP